MCPYVMPSRGLSQDMGALKVAECTYSVAPRLARLRAREFQLNGGRDGAMEAARKRRHYLLRPSSAGDDSAS